LYSGAYGLQIPTRRELRIYELIDVDVGITDGQRGCVAEPLQ
jgi:hypothetical protein